MEQSSEVTIHRVADDLSATCTWGVPTGEIHFECRRNKTSLSAAAPSPDVSMASTLSFFFFWKVFFWLQGPRISPA